MDSLTVKVTAEDIENGVRAHPFSCPIAQAALRAGLGRTTVSGAYMITGYGDIHREIYVLPENAVEFICDFDSSMPVEPFEFTAERI